MQEKQPSLTLFIDPLSQPARSVLCLCKLAKIPFNTKIITITKMQQRSKEFARINPNRKIPAMIDIVNGEEFFLFESGAMMRYICNRYLPPDNEFYPRNDPIKRAKIEEMITFHHKYVRPGSRAMYSQMVAPMMGLADMFNVEEERKNAAELAVKVEKIYSENKGDLEEEEEEPLTIADLLILPEVSQYMYGGVDLENFPRIVEKLEHFFEIAEIGEVHEEFWGMVKDMEMKIPRAWFRFIAEGDDD